MRIFGINVIGGTVNGMANSILESKSSIISPVRDTLVYFKSKKNLEEENKNLRSENINLKLNIFTNQTTSNEFEIFKNEFGLISTSTPIKVVFKPPFMPFDMFRLSGELGKYSVGNLVFYQDVIIGTIIEKSDTYANVELFSTPNKITPALINGVQFEARGLGGGRYVLDVPKDFEVTESDAIVYPHEKVVLLGIVGQVESNQEDLFKKIYFNTPVPLNTISYVTIKDQLYEPAQLID